MQYIKLPIGLGTTVAGILKGYGIEPRVNSLGLLSLEFTQEELDMIKELNIVNPQHGSLNGIENLKCLEKLSISTTGETAYDKTPTSISDKDIKTIGMINTLKSLEIDNQRGITWVYLDNLSNLEELRITKNTSLQDVVGLDKLTKLKEITEYGNKELYQIENIATAINNNDLDVLELDVLHYDEVVKDCPNIKDMINCSFSEQVIGKQKVSYSYYQMLLFHKRCLQIAKLADGFSSDKMEKIIYLENLLAKKISYDYDGRDSENRVHTEDGKQVGKSNGTNSAYNGIMFGSAVCEGYTRSMQYILKQMGIKSKNVHCIGGANRITINEFYHNQVNLPDSDYHSIIRIEDENHMYYCDPCWDSCRYHRGDKSLPYCLLTKKEMSKSHTLSFEEDNIIFDIGYPREFLDYAILNIDTYNKEILNGIKESKNR